MPVVTECQFLDRDLFTKYLQHLHCINKDKETMTLMFQEFLNNYHQYLKNTTQTSESDIKDAQSDIKDAQSYIKDAQSDIKKKIQPKLGADCAMFCKNRLFLRKHKHDKV